MMPGYLRSDNAHKAHHLQALGDLLLAAADGPWNDADAPDLTFDAVVGFDGDPPWSASTEDDLEKSLPDSDAAEMA
jgi:hypothetical protein